MPYFYEQVLCSDRTNKKIEMRNNNVFKKMSSYLFLDLLFKFIVTSVSKLKENKIKEYLRKKNKPKATTHPTQTSQGGLEIQKARTDNRERGENDGIPNAKKHSDDANRSLQMSIVSLMLDALIVNILGMQSGKDYVDARCCSWRKINLRVYVLTKSLKQLLMECASDSALGGMHSGENHVDARCRSGVR